MSNCHENPCYNTDRFRLPLARLHSASANRAIRSRRTAERQIIAWRHNECHRPRSKAFRNPPTNTQGSTAGPRLSREPRGRLPAIGLALASRLGRISIDWKTRSLRLSLPREQAPRRLPEHRNRGRRSLATACCRGPSTGRLSRSGGMWSGEVPESPRRDRARGRRTQQCEVCLASPAVKSGVARFGLIDRRTQEGSSRLHAILYACHHRLVNGYRTITPIPYSGDQASHSIPPPWNLVGS